MSALSFEQSLRAAETGSAPVDRLVALGFAMLSQQRIADAAAAFQRAIALNPNSGSAHYGFSWTLLAQGDFDRGWIEHEWRAACRNLPGHVRSFAQPRWDGSPLNGRTILLYQEQGLGDAIQYVRYAKLVAERGGRVLLGVPEHLGKLLIRTPGVAQIAPHPNLLPPFDVHLSLHSLPLVFRTTLATMPAQVPYVFADAAAIEIWKARMKRDNGTLHVGICWAGSRKHENDRLRSIDPSLLAALANVKGVRFYSLQKELTLEQSRRLPDALNIMDFGPQLTDFDQTAAALMNLDLIITVDTSLAHLAGALARPVWTLLPFHADWRWLLHRSDSPWYPTMRLIRQSRPDDWVTVLHHVAAELSQLARG